MTAHCMGLILSVGFALPQRSSLAGHFRMWNFHIDTCVRFNCCPACLQGGISVGTLEPGEQGGAGARSGAETRWPGGWRATWQAQQRGCVRFNCADSLDRTNAASYFCAVQARPDWAPLRNMQKQAVKC